MSKNDTLLQCFEWYVPNDGTFWNHVKELAPSLADMGITAAWLPPAYKGQAGIDDVGYGVYDMYDLGEFDQKGTVRTKYGTKKQYLSAVKALQEHNVAVLADIVFNQRMGADEMEYVEAVETNASDREEVVSGEETIHSWTRFTFPGRKGKYSNFVWDHTCFDGTDWNNDNKKTAIYLFKGKEWDNEVDSEDGNYDYLMGCDVDISNPAVRDELYRWGEWYMDTVHPDGVRLDAVKHIDFHFFEGWLGAMREHMGNNMFAIGEYWNSDLGKLLHYLDVNENCLSLFDVSLHFRFYNAANSGGNYDMGSLLQDTLVEARPMNAVTFVDNHDTQPGQALSSFIMSWFKEIAYATILLRVEGLPCVFYGDLYGIPHDGVAKVEALEKLIKIRYDYAYGNQCDYFDDQNVVGWTREGDEENKNSGIAVIMSDGAGGTKTMYVGSQHAGEVWVDALGHVGDEVTIGEDGNAQFRVDGGSVSVFLSKEAAASLM